MGDPATTGSLLEAMLAVQAEAPKLKKSATNPHFKSKYAPLDTIVETIGPILAKHKLVWTTQPAYNDAFGPSLKYKLLHAPTGNAEAGEMPLLLSKNDAQGQGSAITYARRYALCAVLNLVADDDDDGARASAERSSSGSTYGQAPRPTASAKQLGYLKGLLKKHKVTAGEVRALFAGVGLEVGEQEDVHVALERLSSAQASNVIDFVSKQPIPTGESDVPSDASEFKQQGQGQEGVD